MKSIIFRLRHRLAILRWERKNGKFGQVPF
jgi:hypothetical protein